MGPVEGGPSKKGGQKDEQENHVEGFTVLFLWGIVLSDGAALAGPLDEIIAGAKKQGIPRHSMLSYPGMIDFHFTKDYGKWRKEVKLILETGGKR